jgi:hypothetical protein
MKIIGPDNTYIDYFHSDSGVSRYGIRVREGLCLVVEKVGDREPETAGKLYPVPVNFDSLPIRVRMIVHRLSHPSSDLSDVLTGTRSFREALNLPARGASPTAKTAGLR